MAFNTLVDSARDSLNRKLLQLLHAQLTLPPSVTWALVAIELVQIVAIGLVASLVSTVGDTIGVIVVVPAFQGMPDAPLILGVISFVSFG